MSRGTFWCLVITTARGAALMFAVKVSKNIKNFENFFFQKKIFFDLKNTFKSSQHKKVKKKFFRVNSAFSFLRPKDQPFIS